MVILKKRKLEIRKKYIFLSALLFSFVVLLQVFSTEQGSSFIESFRHVVLFVSIYAFWALSIEYINGIVAPLETSKSRTPQILIRLVGVAILVFLNLIVSNFLYYGYLVLTSELTINNAYLDFKPFIIKSILIRLIDILVIGIILKFIEANRKVQAQSLKVISLENQLHLSHLEALRNQLNPHFLFNSLHTLNTLIGYDNQKAQAMVIKITNLLRSILDNRQRHLISFEEELEYFKSYLEIEEERFYDRLEIDINIEGSTKNILVPSLILQPLIENAFKHGIARIEGKGKIKLSAKVEDNIFIIKLSNSINKNNEGLLINTTKIGLENLESRLKQMYGKDYLFTTSKNEDTFIATVQIKLRANK